MITFIAENISELFHPSSLLDWLGSIVIIVGGSGFIFALLCVILFLLWNWIYITIPEKKKEEKYPGLLKKYYQQYGDYVFETEEFIDEIHLLYDEKTPQEIRLDLKNASTKVGDNKDKTKKGIWLVVVKNDMKIHPLNKEVIISHIRINGNSISFLERVQDREQRIQANRWTYSVDISRYQVSDSADDDIWKDCLRYNVYKNTILNLLVKAMADCYNISSCFLTDDKAKRTCKQYMNQLNPLIQPYHIRTIMTQESWQFYFNDAPITLEEVIKKLPDEALFKRVDPLSGKPILSIEEELVEKEVRKLTKQLDSLLESYGITIRKSEKGREYFYNGTPITLEDAIRKIPDDELLRMSGKAPTPPQRQSKPSNPTPAQKVPPSKPIKAPKPSQSQPRPSSPTPAQKAPTPPPKAPSKPKLSIEEELLNYLKAQPICWEFPLTTQDKALNKFCEALVFSDNVASVSSKEAIRELELTIQKKRARNPRLADHNAAMEGNILAMLYEYSYLMHIFHALDDMKFDTTKVDIQKLWLLIQKDCNARINNLAEAKRKNPTIQIVLDKYNYDHQITQLKVLKDATGREMDYIISFIMAYSLLTVISLLFSNPQLLQPLKPYSADDIAGMMNALVNASAGLRFTAYSR